MTNWNIFINGKSYSRHVCNLRAANAKNVAKVVAEWKAYFVVSRGFAIPDGEITAAPYHGGALDSYGVGRGG